MKGRALAGAAGGRLSWRWRVRRLRRADGAGGRGAQKKTAAQRNRESARRAPHPTRSLPPSPHAPRHRAPVLLRGAAPAHRRRGGDGGRGPGGGRHGVGGQAKNRGRARRRGHPVPPPPPLPPRRRRHRRRAHGRPGGGRGGGDAGGVFSARVDPPLPALAPRRAPAASRAARAGRGGAHGGRAGGREGRGRGGGGGARAGERGRQGNGRVSFFSFQWHCANAASTSDPPHPPV